MDHSGGQSRGSAPRNQPQLRQPLQILPHAYSACAHQHTECAPTGRQVVQRTEPCVFSIHLGETHRRDLRDFSKERWQDSGDVLVPIFSSSLRKNPRQNESSLIQFFNHESVEARMRGAFTDQGQLFSYISPEARVRTDHPLRKIRKLVRDVLGELSLSLSRLYASEGRPSIPPEQ